MTENQVYLLFNVVLAAKIAYKGHIHFHVWKVEYCSSRNCWRIKYEINNYITGVERGEAYISVERMLELVDQNN